jgi:hypothetical protein
MIVQETSLNVVGPDWFTRGRNLQSLLSSIGGLSWSLSGKINVGVWKAKLLKRAQLTNWNRHGEYFIRWAVAFIWQLTSSI